MQSAQRYVNLGQGFCKVVTFDLRGAFPAYNFVPISVGTCQNQELRMFVLERAGLMGTP